MSASSLYSYIPLCVKDSIKNNFIFNEVHHPLLGRCGDFSRSNVLGSSAQILITSLTIPLILIEHIARSVLSPLAAIGLLLKKPQYKIFFDREFTPFGITSGLTLGALIAITLCIGLVGSILAIAVVITVIYYPSKGLYQGGEAIMNRCCPAQARQT